MPEMQTESSEDQPTVHRAPRQHDVLRSLQPHRARAVQAWLSTPIGTCRICGEFVYPTDSRQRDPKEADDSVKAILHLPCLRAEEADAAGSDA